MSEFQGKYQTISASLSPFLPPGCAPYAATFMVPSFALSPAMAPFLDFGNLFFNQLKFATRKSQYVRMVMNTLNAMNPKMIPKFLYSELAYDSHWKVVEN